jgi:hypothetical protein
VFKLRLLDVIVAAMSLNGLPVLKKSAARDHVFIASMSMSH